MTRPDDFAWAQPQPRIVQHNKRRFALRLEQVFWDHLETIAARRAVRIGALVAELAGSYQGPNFASYLRGYIMTETERQQTADATRMGTMSVVDLLRGCPAPGLLLRHDRMILEVNPALMQWMGGDQTRAIRQEKFDTIFDVRVTRPLDETFDLLRTGQLRRTQLHISFVPKVPIGIATPPPRTVLATLQGFKNGEHFYCLVWLTITAPLRFMGR